MMSTDKNSLLLLVILAVASVLVPMRVGTANGQESSASSGSSADAAAAEETAFQQDVQPLLQKYCLRCHNAENMESGIRVDQLTALPEDRQIALWTGILKQVAEGAMPPEDELQLSAAQRESLTDWITRALTAARSRPRPKNGSVRRLTVSQYRNTLRDLLLLEEDLTEVLPPDAMSKDGFANHEQTLLLSPLLVESYFDIAEKALDRCIVDASTKPVIQNFRMDFGASVNPQPCPDKLILGANSDLLNNADFIVTQLQPTKPFAYQPFAMRTKYEFIEGYQGNATVRGWRTFESIYHAVFACVRGTPGYPKGLAHQAVPSGLLLRPAIPSPEIFGQSNTYGPMANFKISLRELPEQGNFRVTVTAARYDDALLLDAGSPICQELDAKATGVADSSTSPVANVTLEQAGIYQVDVGCSPGKAAGLLSLELGERHFAGQLMERQGDPDEQTTAFMIVRLPAGELKVKARYGDNARLRRVVFSRLSDDSDNARRFQTFEQRTPWLGVHVGLRRDCGSTLTQVGGPQPVSGGEMQTFVFEGAINDFPSPDVEQGNVNYLAGVREIGVRSEYTDGRDMPRLLVKSVGFEGPYYESWPPATHRNIFIDSPHKNDLAAYAREVIDSFASRAFRRPVTATESDMIFGVWKQSFDDRRESVDPAESQTCEAVFRQSIKDALLVVLTSPQFLFLIENSSSSDAEALDAYELASKLSYFLWNAPPDQRLLELASENVLHASLDAEIDRMIRDPRCGQFVNEFASQWLRLDKFDVVAVDAQRYPKLTRDAKTQLRQEPIQFLRYLIDQNLPLRNIIQSDFLVANEVVAGYYGLGSRTESGFRFVPVRHENENLGGVLTQAGILAGLSDGRQANPVKRGAWLARKIIAEPPDDPPPNVPQLPDDDGTELTLREKLERHRNQKGCAKCHAGIDPWGLPFESFDAGGRWKPTPVAETRSTLPDGTEVEDLMALQAYLAGDRMDQVAFSFLKHAACYAVGRSLTYNEIVFLQQQALELRAHDYRMQDLLRLVIKSDLFLKK